LFNPVFAISDGKRVLDGWHMTCPNGMGPVMVKSITEVSPPPQRTPEERARRRAERERRAALRRGDQPPPQAGGVGGVMTEEDLGQRS
jgi:hypothetical protein